VVIFQRSHPTNVRTHGIAPWTGWRVAASYLTAQRRDPAIMDATEFSNVHEGQTRATVEAHCGCNGVTGPNPLVVHHNGNVYTSMQYLANSGHKYVFYRWNPQNVRVVGYAKVRCPNDDPSMNQPSLDCDWTYFS